MTNEGMTNDEGSASKTVRSSPPDRAGKVYDLEERTAVFGEEVIGFLKTIQATPLTSNLIDQLIRSSTSIGANYCEADDAGSTPVFRFQISICRRESRESKFWLRMIAKAVPPQRDEAVRLWREARELNLIFSAIYRKLPADKRKRKKPR